MSKIGTREDYHKFLGGKKRFGEDDCPLCENEKGDIIWRGKNWYIVHNLFPYSGDERHIMAVPYRHIKYILELKDEELLELKDIHKFVKDFFGEEEYFSFTRESISNRSIEHLHMHFIVGRLQGRYIRKMLERQGFPIKEELNF